MLGKYALDFRPLVEDHPGHPACHPAFLAHPAKHISEIFERRFLEAAVKSTFGITISNAFDRHYHLRLNHPRILIATNLEPARFWNSLTPWLHVAPGQSPFSANKSPFHLTGKVIAAPEISHSPDGTGGFLMKPPPHSIPPASGASCSVLETISRSSLLAVVTPRTSPVLSLIFLSALKWSHPAQNREHFFHRASSVSILTKTILHVSRSSTRQSSARTSLGGNRAASCEQAYRLSVAACVS